MTSDDLRAARILLVHAHPDDECLATGGVIARYAQAGAEVTVVTCTLGEEGEVIGEQYAQLTSDRADQLGGYRIFELTRALAALTDNGPRPAITPRFLGGAGHYRDSGMAGTPPAANPRAFVNADFDEAVGILVEIIRQLRPHVVITYDPNGTYGHPDHIQAHLVTTAAVEAAGLADSAANSVALAWDSPKFYWAVSGKGATGRALADIGELPQDWRTLSVEDLPLYPDADITTVVDVSAVMDRKRAALIAHSTQVSVSADGTALALSNNVALPVLAEEHFVLVRGHLGPVDASGRETDLLAGVSLGDTGTN